MMKYLIKIKAAIFVYLKLYKKILITGAAILFFIFIMFAMYSSFQASTLSVKADASFKAKNYSDAAKYYRASANFNLFDKSDYKKAILCDKLLTSQLYYSRGLKEIGKSKFAVAAQDFRKVTPESPLYADAKQQALQADIIVQSLGVSSQHYTQGLSALAASQWANAANEFSQVIKLDAHYTDALAKIAEANRHLGVPRIIAATMTKTVGPQNEPIAPATVFSATDKALFLSLQLGAVLKSTKIEYTRYYGNVYVNSGTAYASTDYPQYFSFSWQKSSYTYPKGDYSVKIYLNGYYQTTVNYTVQ